MVQTIVVQILYSILLNGRLDNNIVLVISRYKYASKKSTRWLSVGYIGKGVPHQSPSRATGQSHRRMRVEREEKVVFNQLMRMRKWQS